MWPRLALALAALAVAAPATQALPRPVPPKDCGFMTVKKQRYNVKSDQLRCKKTRKYTKAYLKSGKKPKRFSCAKYGSDTAIEFRCTKGKAVFFAIRR